MFARPAWKSGADLPERRSRAQLPLTNTLAGKLGTPRTRC